MKLPEALENYYYHSGKVSEIGRQVAFAGIALIWIFKVDGQNKVPVELILPAMFILASLVLDVLQYLYATVAWGIFRRKKEKELNAANTPEAEFLAPRALNWPTNVLFYAKVVCLGAGYWLLYQYLAAKLA